MNDGLLDFARKLKLSTRCTGWRRQPAPRIAQVRIIIDTLFVCTLFFGPSLGGTCLIDQACFISRVIAAERLSTRSEARIRTRLIKAAAKSTLLDRSKDNESARKVLSGEKKCLRERYGLTVKEIDGRHAVISKRMDHFISARRKELGLSAVERGDLYLIYDGTHGGNNRSTPVIARLAKKTGLSQKTVRQVAKHIAEVDSEPISRRPNRRRPNSTQPSGAPSTAPVQRQLRVVISALLAPLNTLKPVLGESAVRRIALAMKDAVRGDTATRQQVAGREARMKREAGKVLKQLGVEARAEDLMLADFVVNASQSDASRVERTRLAAVVSGIPQRKLVHALRQYTAFPSDGNQAEH